MKTPKKILDRRKAVRIVESLPFRIGHESFEIEARTVNISSHGVMCVVEKDIALMTKLRIALSLSPSVQIQANAVVVRKERDHSDGQYYLALFFSKISEGHQKKLNTFIQQQLKI